MVRLGKPVKDKVNKPPAEGFLGSYQVFGDVATLEVILVFHLVRSIAHSVCGGGGRNVVHIAEARPVALPFTRPGAEAGVVGALIDAVSAVMWVGEAEVVGCLMLDRVAKATARILGGAVLIGYRARLFRLSWAGGFAWCAVAVGV